jgi:hypothetical protein
MGGMLSCLLSLITLNSADMTTISLGKIHRSHLTRESKWKGLGGLAGDYDGIQTSDD